MTSLAVPSPAALSHIPHLPGVPFVGHTLRLLRDPYGLHGECAQKLGPVYKIKLLGQWRVAFNGLEANDFIFTDPLKCLSSHDGWDMVGAVFPGGLMLRDFQDHRAHRRLMQTAFRKPVMDAYRDRVSAVMPGLQDRWRRDRPFRFYPAIKDLTLRMSSAVFMGLDIDDARVDGLNHAFRDEVRGAVGVIRKPLPFTALRRGLKARAFLLDTFREMIPERRRAPGEDFFSQMCVAQGEDGAAWSEEDILNHFNFLMMAAHDTTAASITKSVWALTTMPELQDRVQAEIDALGDAPLDDAALASLEVTDRVFREALRLLPPVPFIPRRTTRAFDWQGYHIPAGTWVSCLPAMAMRSEQFWDQPLAFDPDRFSPNRAEHRHHKYLWAPFGGGAHKCIGMHFAFMEAKVFLFHLLRRYRVELAQSGPVAWRALPIPRPKGDLPIRLVARGA